MLWDHETGSLWFGGAGPAGWSDLICIGGPLQDRHLERVDLRRTVWRTWQHSHPGSKIMRRRR